MAQETRHDAWSAGHNYDHYMGRWSRLIAPKFLAWIEAPDNTDWVDIGCGTGALTRTILQEQNPRSVTAIDPSAAFISHARDAIDDPRVRFSVAGAEALPLEDSSVGIAVSALVLNFVPDKAKALLEMRRVVRPGGRAGFYVWDYPGGGIGFIRAFWTAAIEIDSSARDLTESRRFPFCTPEGLEKICRLAGWEAAEIMPIETVTTFPDFEAFWQPFTLGSGPAPGFCMSLSDEKRGELRKRLAETLGTDAPISLPARAWAVRIKFDQR